MNSVKDNGAVGRVLVITIRHYDIVISEGEVLRDFKRERAFCDAYAMRGTCTQEGAMHFSGQLYIIQVRKKHLQKLKM